MRLPPELIGAEAPLRAMLGPIDGIEPLPSGTGGRSFLVTASGRRVVAKVFAEDASVLVDAARQFELLAVLAVAGIAPAPIGYDTASRLLLVTFVADAQPGSARDLRAPDQLARVTALLRRLHSVDFELPALAPTACAERYLARIGGSSELTAADRERYAELLALADLPWSESACLCHNDLTADNVLLCEQSWLIDFDYAVAAAPVLDLASLAVMNDFDRGDCQALLESYYGGPPPIPAEEFARVQRLVRLLAHFWALASGQAGAAGLAQYRINHD